MLLLQRGAEEPACEFEARKRAWDREQKEKDARAGNERRALLLAKDFPLKKDDTFELKMGSAWERLLVLEVSDAISHRANFGQIKVYSCKSLTTGKLYPQVDLSSWRGAEGACQVRRVKHAPAPPAPPPTVRDPVLYVSLVQNASGIVMLQF